MWAWCTLNMSRGAKRLPAGAVIKSSLRPSRVQGQRGRKLPNTKEECWPLSRGQGEHKPSPGTHTNLHRNRGNGEISSVLIGCFSSVTYDVIDL
ncbi:hypothetical protein AVEN_47418-1 [Araneus ventricosus]|uniref:Uncharacterized protein n=1 Tax=Araneus ventricosus TaxID=182803 RepID=A0A4Y2IWQ7_ARAVE|nr:hypothetical protein AVEN_47418-1 [Araneus ventricosus]